MPPQPLRGMIFVVNLNPTIGHEQANRRPCLVIQNDVGNRHSSTTIIVPLTDAVHKAKPSPVFVLLHKGEGGTTKDSYILCDQIRTVDKQRLIEEWGSVSEETLKAVDKALTISLGLALPAGGRVRSSL